jgi:hypothetical protein
VGRAIVLTDVGLELDDAADPTAGGGTEPERRIRFPNESGAQQGARDFEGGAREEGAIDDGQVASLGQARGNIARSASGMNRPVTARNPGTSVWR